MAGSRMAADWSRASEGPPPRARDDEDQDDEDQDADEPSADEDDEDQGDEDDGDQGGARAPVSLPGGGLAGAGAGWVLGFLLWGWVALPFIKGGPTAVKNTLRAKFLNQSPDGSALP